MHTKLRSFSRRLQGRIELSDDSWDYAIGDLPSGKAIDENGLVISISVTSNATKQEILLHLGDIPRNRVTAMDSPSSFLLLSFADFRLRVPSKADPEATEPATAKESAAYISRLLEKGIKLNKLHYNFYGHSNSQLKSRSCFMFAASSQTISKKIEALGQFSKITSVAKKAKRIGLLFSSATAAAELKIAQCEDIADVQSGNYVFTDGCGQLAPRLAHKLVKGAKIAFRNRKYVPSVFQIRYRGYKGILTYEPTMHGEILARFRESMKKFGGGPDWDLSVVDYSKVSLIIPIIVDSDLTLRKPYAFGFLNDEIVLLLHALGVSQDTLLQKQSDYIHFLSEAETEPIKAFQLCASSDNLALAERILLDGVETVQQSVRKLVQRELDRMMNKRDEQRCRIMIPESRLLFGVCDPYGILEEGQCFVRITSTGDGVPRTLEGADVIVARNPCLHPGDLQKFRLVANHRLSHLVDCIVFPVKGKRPSADLMSGGDLDGDKFFVSWDPSIVPATLSEAAEYPAAKEKVVFRPVTDLERLKYFANFTSSSLGRVKNLYLDWARAKGPFSVQCQELNRLFSQCVDGNRIKIPAHLEEAPKPEPTSPPFVLDVLHLIAKDLIRSLSNRDNYYDGYTFDAVQLLLSSESLPLSEFELVQITLRWCRARKVSFLEFLPFFDVEALKEHEKMWLLSLLPPLRSLPGLMLNGLLRSDILDPTEVARFELDHPGLRWKRFFSSTTARLECLLDNVRRSLELFHKSFIVLEIDDRLAIGILVPMKSNSKCDCAVGARVRIFAFPKSQDNESSNYRVVPTKVNYKLYCDESTFQLYDNKRANTFIFITHGPLDDASYRNTKNESDRRRLKQQSFDQGRNSPCRTSIALDKIGKDVQKHVGLVNRTGIMSAEVFVLSNRDIDAFRTFDLWLDHVDTQGRVPLFDSEACTYALPSLRSVDWAAEPSQIVKIVKEGDLTELAQLPNSEAARDVMLWMADRRALLRLREAFQYVSNELSTTWSTESTFHALFEVALHAPSLILVFLESKLWGDYAKTNLDLDTVGFQLLEALIKHSNDMGELAVQSFQAALTKIPRLSLTGFAELTKLIAIVVHSPELALDLLLEQLEMQSFRILTGRPRVISRFVKSVLGIALDHVDEMRDASGPKNRELLNLTRNNSLVEMRIRIDSPLAQMFKGEDHVRLIAATAPTNDHTTRKACFDGLVTSAESGKVFLKPIGALPPFVEECSWILQSCISFVTTNTMFDAVTSFYNEKEKSCPLFSVISLQSDDVQHPVPVSRKDFDGYELNDSQKTALQAAEECQLCLVWGPPGTGKTQTISAMLWRALEIRPEEKILVSAPTHNAVDNMLRKFLNNRRDGHEKPNVLRVTTNVARVAIDLREYTCNAIFGADINDNYSARRKAQALVKSSNIIFTTCIGAGIGLLRDVRFDTVFIDEASQQTEPASLVPLVKGASRAVLVGDHVQLRATVQLHAVTQEFDISLFERLHVNVEDGRSGVRKVLLDTQYRMHAEISKFSSEEFYHGRIMTATRDSPLESSLFPWPAVPHGTARRMVFVQCDSPEDIGRKSKSNKGQAEVCKVICRLLRSCTEGASTPSSSITILSPYTSQVELLRKSVPGVEVASVDGFQGREADVIVFCTVRCNIHADKGFLNDMRRLNVAITRPKAGLIIVGDLKTLTSGEHGAWNRLVSVCAKVDINGE